MVAPFFVTVRLDQRTAQTSSSVLLLFQAEGEIRKLILAQRKCGVFAAVVAVIWLMLFKQQLWSETVGVSNSAHGTLRWAPLGTERFICSGTSNYYLLMYFVWSGGSKQNKIQYGESHPATREPHAMPHSKKAPDMIPLSCLDTLVGCCNSYCSI